jgi:hypothetical protein
MQMLWSAWGLSAQLFFIVMVMKLIFGMMHVIVVTAKYGFYSRDSLASLRFKHQYANKELERNNPDLSIVERPYQIEAIKTLSHKFQDQGRKALIIQATVQVKRVSRSLWLNC